MIKDFNYISYNEDESMKLGSLFSGYLNKGDILGLEGDLGSGKTTFVKGIMKGLNYADSVTSPTFSLINEYEADFKVIHVDFYRDNNIKRWKNIGFEEIIFNNDIILIEWSNLIPSLLPKNIRILLFEHLDLSKRKISLK